MLGAIAGDMIGSPYERYPIKTKILIYFLRILILPIIRFLRLLQPMRFCTIPEKHFSLDPRFEAQLKN